MDVSDGLVKDLDRLLRASGVAGRLVAGGVPLAAATRKVVEQAPERLVGLITSGDDYEVLATVPGDKARAFATAAMADFGHLAWSGRESGTWVRVEARLVGIPAGAQLCLRRITATRGERSWIR
jgi:thiamine monophosphate kinase